MATSAEEQPVAVPEGAKRDRRDPGAAGAGSNRRSGQSECWRPSNEGVKGGRWFSLIDKVHTERTLRAAFHQVATNQGAAGVDHVTIAMFTERLEENLT